MAIIELKDIHKTYHLGENLVRALAGVSLAIEAGEFVAIMGPSGSGKSTLLQILGLLDPPESGSYLLDGKEVGHRSEDELAVLRREAIGFVFQQFNLLPRMNALENVALPLLYSEGKIDLEKSQMLLARVGLSERVAHRANELSGGQQQRVAIARSLVNRPRMILADEPTGNLDSTSQDEIMDLLVELNRQGMTVILVTHEEDVALRASRLIRMRDGHVLSDERVPHQVAPAQETPDKSSKSPTPKDADDEHQRTNLWEHFREGFRALGANKVRTALSMLGILIGVAAVVAMLALGKGAQKAIETQLASLGSNLLVLFPGAVRVGGVVLDTGAVTRLSLEDAEAIREKIPMIKRTAPAVSGRGQVTYQDRNWGTQILGVEPTYAEMRAAEPEIGSFFTTDDNARRTRVALLGTTALRELFGNTNPIGESIKINKVIFQVVGILPKKGATGFRDQDDVVLIPLQTAMHRLLGKDYADYIDIEVGRAEDVDAAQQAVMDLMLSRHRVPPSQKNDAFQIRNMADLKKAFSESSRTMSVLLAIIATISLVVGGIGIMNIMMVSVTERTREIGLRKAIGARRADILAQFLAEAVVVSTIGGLLGIFFGWATSEILARFSGWATAVSLGTVLLAFFFSGSIGVIFGLYPARKASLLSPIEALRHE